MGQQGRALLFLLPSERDYVARLKGHGVQVQQGNLMQHLTHLQSPADSAPLQVRLLHDVYPLNPSLDVHSFPYVSTHSRDSTLSTASQSRETPDSFAQPSRQCTSLGQTYFWSIDFPHTSVVVDTFAEGQ